MGHTEKLPEEAREIDELIRRLAQPHHTLPSELVKLEIPDTIVLGEE